VVPGSPVDDKLGELRELAAMAEEHGLPLLAEAVPVSLADVQAHTVKNIAKAARIWAEAGADFVNVHFAGKASVTKRPRSYMSGYQKATVNLVSGRLGLPSGRSGRLWGTAR
jgi:DhnA family fructose-bisphosphate aldolase class Ia